MTAIQPLFLILAIFPSAAPVASPPLPAEDPARWLELLRDRQHPWHQSQAALALVQSRHPDAAEIVRHGLKQSDSNDIFLALAAALRLTRDRRFNEELLAAVRDGPPPRRQAAADTLAVLVDEALLEKLRALLTDPRQDVAVRQAALWTLGRCGRKETVPLLLDQVAGEPELLRLAAAAALEELTGLSYGTDAARWRNWWQSHKDLSAEDWLEGRLTFQASRARRLRGDLAQARAEVVRLHQQLYSRLPVADRLGHIQTLVDHEDPAVRALVIPWCAELYPTADAVGQGLLISLLLRLSRDGALEIQRQAVLALGRVNDAQATEQIRRLLRHGEPAVRAAAARALTQQTLGPHPAAQEVKCQVVPLLQKALDDPALEVVLAAAENLGALGVPEAGPVLAALLRHPSESVRQTAAQALERVAEPGVLEVLMTALDDPAATVRFSLVGAIGRAANDGQGLNDADRTRLITRLEELLLRDTDPGVRSRSATVLGQCGNAGQLPFLYRRLQAREDNRVQQKVWEAMIEIIARSANLSVLHQWDQTLAQSNQGARRLQLLTEVCARWKKADQTQTLAAAASEALIQAQLDEGKWTTAFPLVRELLPRPATDAEMDKRLRWLLLIGQLAHGDGNRPEVLRVVQEAQPYLSGRPEWTAKFEDLEKKCRAQ
ncbi:MAG: HEAT repeat domain-containing protein [Gemmataceae bacterium]